MATNGTERKAMAIGITARSAVREKLKPTAATSAAAVPARRPTAASRAVVSEAATSSCRAAPLPEAVT